MKTVEWKIHLKSDPGQVFRFLSTAHGREKFWAEKAPEKDGFICFTFPNGQRYEAEILHTEPDRVILLDYFNSVVEINLAPSEHHGTDLKLVNSGVAEEEYLTVHAGWVSILLNLKAAVDCKCDLRNHNKKMTWDQNYADN